MTPDPLISEAMERLCRQHCPVCGDSAVRLGEHHCPRRVYGCMDVTFGENAVRDAMRRPEPERLFVGLRLVYPPDPGVLE